MSEPVRLTHRNWTIGLKVVLQWPPEPNSKEGKRAEAFKLKPGGIYTLRTARQRAIGMGCEVQILECGGHGAPALPMEWFAVYQGDPKPAAPCTRVLFLDFDGVILTLRTKFADDCAWSRAKPDPITCQVLRRICATGVRLVISSTWREFGKSRCHEKLTEGGLAQWLHDDWSTTVSNDRQAVSARPREIAEWLAKHPEVTDYRILDDDPFEWLTDQVPKWIVCNAEDGLRANEMHELIEWGIMPTATPEAEKPGESAAKSETTTRTPAQTRQRAE